MQNFVMVIFSVIIFVIFIKVVVTDQIDNVASATLSKAVASPLFNESE